MKRALDLFCGAGGATRGLQRAGFHVLGYDITKQPNYIGDDFVRLDAFKLTPGELTRFDLVWASPPCQGRTAYKRRPNHVRPVDTDGAITKIRTLLRASGVPFIIENVPGAPLESPITLCGSMFGLDVRRHRCFETSWALAQPACRHHLQQGDFPPATNRKNRRKTAEIGVWRIPLATQRLAMGIDWMELQELSEAIPPAYSQWLALRFLADRAANVDTIRGFG